MPLAEPATVSPDLLARSLSRLQAGKNDSDESFPVASRILPAATRDAILSFYRFARAADDIADSPLLTPAVKLAALDAAEHALLGIETAQTQALAGSPAIVAADALRDTLSEKGLAADSPCRLLQAFRKDAVQNRYRDWSDLLLYCTYSAAPVGRFLLDLHGEDRALRAHADPLCNAHQILNHLQDCGADYRKLDRVYLPQRWLAEAGAVTEMLDEPSAPAALRLVIDRMLDGVDRLLAASAPLPAGIADRGLRMQAAATLAMGRRLAAALRRRDPLAGRVGLSRAAKAACGARGLVAGFTGRRNGRRLG